MKREVDWNQVRIYVERAEESLLAGKLADENSTRGLIWTARWALAYANTRQRITIGQYEIFPTDPGKIVIARLNDGEAMQTDEAKLERAIANFYATEF